MYNKIISDPKILREVSSTVNSIEEANTIYDNLRDTLKNHINGLGLSAIQIGIPKQYSIIKKADGDFISLINPVILETNDEFVFCGEGCLSFPDLYIDTKRFKKIKIKNMKLINGGFEEEILDFCYGDKNSYNDILCIAVQHEIDHQKGIIFVEKESEKTKTFVREGEKIGRNDKCPCGSGKKYKNCCLVKKIG